MCVIASLYNRQKDKKNQDALELFASFIEGQSSVNKDGFSILADFPFTYHRKDKYSRDNFTKALGKSAAVHTHLRMATTGTVHEKNAHYWRHSNWYFAHNGTVRDYSSASYGGYVNGKWKPAKKEKKDEFTHADSFLFFKELMKGKRYINGDSIDWEAVAGLVDDKDLFGRFTLVNPTLKRAYYFGDFHAYLLYNDALMLSSTDVDFTQWYEFWGSMFDQEIETPHFEIDGIYCVDYGKDKFYKVMDKPKVGFGFKKALNKGHVHACVCELCLEEDYKGGSFGKIVKKKDQLKVA